MRPRGTFGEAWRLYRAHAPRVLAIAAAVQLVFLALAALLVAQLGAAGFGLAVLLWLTASFWLQAPLAQLVSDVRAERPWPGARATFDRILPHTGAISAAALLAGIGVGLGLYLLVVPGLFLLTRWSLLVPVIVVEEVGTFRAFARSRDLVRGHGWRVFGTILVTLGLLLAALFAIGVLSGIAAGLGASSGVAELAASAVSAFVVLTLVAPFIALVWTVRYLEYSAERPPLPPERWSRLPVGDTLDEAWEVYKRHPSRLLALGAGVAALVLGVTLLPLGSDLGALVLLATTLVAYVWLAGIFAEGLDTYADAPPRAWLRGRLAVTGRRLVGLLVLGLVGGLLFMTVVGLVALLWWSIAGAVVTVENTGALAALRRSAALVRGRRRRVLKLVALSLTVALLASVAVSAVVPPLAGIGGLALGAAVTALTAPYVALAWALMYRQLRELEAAASAPELPAVAPAPVA